MPVQWSVAASVAAHAAVCPGLGLAWSGLAWIVASLGHVAEVSDRVHQMWQQAT